MPSTRLSSESLVPSSGTRRRWTMSRGVRATRVRTPTVEVVMSVKVELSELGEAMGRHDYAFLVCLGEERPHVLGVRPRLDGDRLVVDRIGSTATRLVG